MVLSIHSQTFHDTLRRFSDAISKSQQDPRDRDRIDLLDPEDKPHDKTSAQYKYLELHNLNPEEFKVLPGLSFAEDVDAQHKFLEALDVDPEEFKRAFTEYQAIQKEHGRRVKHEVTGEDRLISPDFRPWSSIEGIKDVPGLRGLEALLGAGTRFGGRTVGQLVGGLESLGKMTLGNENVKAIEAALESAMPDSVERQMSAFLDPYHGDGTLGAVEDIFGQIASILFPLSWGLKAGTGAANLASRAGRPGAALKSYLSNLWSKTPVKLATTGVATAAVEGTMHREEARVMDEILDSKDEHLIRSLDKLAKNPQDSESAKVVSEFMNSMMWMGPLLGGPYVLAKAWQKFMKTRAGKRVTRLGKEHIARNFSSRKGTDDNTLAMNIERNNAAQKAMAEADGLSQDLDRALRKNDLKGKSDKEVDDFLETVVNEALGGNLAAYGQLSDDAARLVGEMRNNLDKLSRYVGKNIFRGDMQATVLRRADDPGKLGTYINRSYRIFDDSDYSKKMIKAVQSYAAGKKIKDADTEQLLDDTAAFIRNELGESATDTEVINALQKLVDKGNVHTDSLFDIVQGSGVLTSSSKAAKARSDIPPEIRALWGEVKNPMKNYMNTYTKLAEMKAEHTFIQDITKHLLATGKATKNKIAGEGYQDLSKIMKDRASAVFNPQSARQYLESMPAIKEIYVSPEYAKAMKDVIMNKNWLLEMIGKLKGTTQTMKTVYNPATHGNNTFGNMIIMAANGMSPFGTKGFSPAFDATKARISGKSNKELGQYIGKMIGYGLANSNVTIGLIRQNLNRMGKEKTFLKGLGDTKVARVYEGEDFIFKVAHFENTLDYLKKAYPQESLQKLERMAAERTRDLMPNYNLVPRAFKALRYSPVGDFVAFPAEIARISKNLVKYTAKDLTSGIDPLKKEAYKRLGGMTGVALVPEIAEDESARLHGIDAEQRRALDMIDHAFYMGSNKIYTSGLKRGKDDKIYVDKINLGNLYPFVSIGTAVKGAHNLLLDNKLRNSEMWDRVGLSVLDKTLSPFVGTSMLTDALLKVHERPTSWTDYNDKTVGGAALKIAGIYSGYPRTAAVTSQLYAPFEPGFGAYLRRRHNFETAKAAQYGFDSWTDAIGKIPTGDEITSYYTPVNRDAFLDLMGLTTNRQAVSDSVRNNLSPYKRDIDSAQQDFNKEMTNPNLLPEDKEKLKRVWRNSQDKRLNALKGLRGMLSYYDDLGLNDGDLQIGFTEQPGYTDDFSVSMGDYVTLARENTFRPFQISDDVRQTIQRGPGSNPAFEDFVQQLLLELDQKEGELVNTKIEK